MDIISLNDSFRQGNVKIGDYFDYHPIIRKCVLTEKQTGWCKRQDFETEKLKWRVDKVNKDIILIADKPTTAEVFLAGKTAYNVGVTPIDQLCKQLYLDPVIADRVICITVSIQKNISECNIGNMKKYWLGNFSAYGSDYDDDIWLALGCISYGKCYGYVYVYLNSEEYSESLGVRPVIYLKLNVLIMRDKDCDGSEEKPWKFSKMV